jgi:hypothetical protein
MAAILNLASSSAKKNRSRLKAFMRYLAGILIILLLATPAFSVELFRYRGAAKDGGTLEYVFDTDEQHVPKTVTEKKVAEIAADFMTSYYAR